MNSSNIIDDFRGKYRFLSNFYRCDIEFPAFAGRDLKFNSSEAAFQAMKCANLFHMMQFTGSISPFAAKRLGRRVQIRPDWEDIKFDVMRKIVEAKFIQNPQLMDKLVETYPAILIEANTWHDNTWGNCTCEKCADICGKNWLGSILMSIRDNEVAKRGILI